LHLHDLVAYQSTSDEAMSVCRSPLTVRTLPPLLYFFNLQYVKELCKFRLFESVLIVSKYTVLFPSILIFSEKVLNFSGGGGGGNRTPVLLRQSKDSFTGLV
jgi:hypothetical protein